MASPYEGLNEAYRLCGNLERIPGKEYIATYTKVFNEMQNMKDDMITQYTAIYQNMRGTVVNQERFDRLTTYVRRRMRSTKPPHATPTAESTSN